TVPLNVWNDSASSGTVLVVIAPMTATSDTITLSFASPVDARATIDKFFWDGTATLTYRTGIGIDGSIQTTSWTQSAGTGFIAGGFQPQFDHLITDDNNGNPAFHTVTFNYSGTLGSCFAAHVNRPDSTTNAFVENQGCGAVSEPVSLLLLGP